MTTTSTTESERLREYIEEHCGVALGDDRADLLESRLADLRHEQGCEDLAAFNRLIRQDTGPGLRDRIVEAVTSGATQWFRDTHPFLALKDILLPRFAEELASGQRTRVRIWSAGCSTGQEPYSIAMSVQEFCRAETALRPEHLEILGTDISPSALMMAMVGRYDRMAVSLGLPSEMLARYFRQELRTWEIKADVKNMVVFKNLNLQDSPDGLNGFDAVFLRYVVGEFTESLQKKILADLTTTLCPSGYLFLGQGESLPGLSDTFETMVHAGGRYHRRIA